MRLRARMAAVAAVAAGVCLAAAGQPPAVEWTILNDYPAPPQICARAGGGLYVSTTTAYPQDGVIARYDPDGSLVWSSLVHSADGSTETKALAPTPDGGCLVTGDTYGALDGNPRPIGAGTWVRKYDGAGTPAWGAQIDTAKYDFVIGLACDAQGRAYVLNSPWTTNYGQPTGPLYTGLNCYSPTGQKLWSTDLVPADGSWPGGWWLNANSLAVTPQGQSHMAFYNYRSVTQNHNTTVTDYPQLATVSPDGQSQSVLPDTRGLTTVRLDNQGNLYGTTIVSLVKLSPQGQLVWEWTQPQGRSLYLVDLCVAANHHVFAAGYRSSELTGAIAEFDENGQMLWEKDFATPQKWTQFKSICLGDDGRVYASAWVTPTDGSAAHNFIVCLTPEPGSAMVVLLVAGALLRRGRRAGEKKTESTEEIPAPSV